MGPLRGGMMEGLLASNESMKWIELKGSSPVQIHESLHNGDFFQFSLN